MRLIDIQGQYDLFVSLGSACDPAAHLRTHGLRRFSMPLDWVVSGSLADVRRLFQHRFAGFMDLEFMEPIDGSANYYDEEAANRPGNDQIAKTHFIKDKRFDILSVHDFPILPGQPWHSTYPAFRKKLHLRIERLLDGLAKATSILFVRWAGQIEEAMALHPVLSATTAGEVRLLVLQPENSASSVNDLATDANGICLVKVPNIPADIPIWDEVLRGMSLRA